MPKVVLIDNFNRETVSDFLQSEGLTQEEAEKEAAEFNSHLNDFSPRYAVVKPDDYQLYTWEP